MWKLITESKRSVAHSAVRVQGKTLQATQRIVPINIASSGFRSTQDAQMEL
jgi:hypothetical protein